MWFIRRSAYPGRCSWTPPRFCNGKLSSAAAGFSVEGRRFPFGLQARKFRAKPTGNQAPNHFLTSRRSPRNPEITRSTGTTDRASHRRFQQPDKMPRLPCHFALVGHNWFMTSGLAEGTLGVGVYASWATIEINGTKEGRWAGLARSCTTAYVPNGKL